MQVSLSSLFTDPEIGPGLALHVTKQTSRPFVFVVFREEVLGDEIRTAGMSDGGSHFHLLRHAPIDHLSLNGAARKEAAPIPLGNAAR